MVTPHEDGPPGTATGKAAGPSPGALPPLRILLVEDNETNSFVFVKFILKLGHAPQAALTGTKALECLARERFDLVLMDIEMPGMDGFETARRIWAGEAGPLNRATPIIALTAHAAREGYEEKCRKAGMDGFLSKPLDIAILSRTLGGIAARADRPAEEPECRCDPVADPGGAGAAAAAVFDQGTALDRFDGDREIFESFRQVVLDRYGQGIPDLIQAAGREDLAEFTRLAHSIKSTFAQLGADSCRALAAQLEQAGRDADRDLIASRLPELERELAALLDVL
jgi:CheY-like chemotaxis protein